MTDEKKAPEITPEAFAKLQSDFAEAQELLMSQKGALSKLEENNKLLVQEKLDAKKAAQKAAEESARKGGDIDALEKSWKEKFDTEISGRDSVIAEKDRIISSMTVGEQAQKMAAEMALPGSASLLLLHIERRLAVDIKDGKAVVRVLDQDGKPSALSIDDLKKEFGSNPAFAPILVGSMANGAGPVGEKAQTAAKTMKRREFDNLSMMEQDKFIESGGVPVDS